MKRLHEFDTVPLPGLPLQSFLLLGQFFVDEALYVILVSRPQILLGILDGVESSTLDHQILGAPDNEIGIDLRLLILHLPHLDLIEIHYPPFVNALDAAPRYMSSADTTAQYGFDLRQAKPKEKIHRFRLADRFVPSRFA